MSHICNPVGGLVGFPVNVTYTPILKEKSRASISCIMGARRQGGGGPDIVDIVDDQKIIAFDLDSGEVELTCLEEALLKGCGFGNMDLRSPQVVSDCLDCVPLGVSDDDAGSNREGADQTIEVELVEECGGRFPSDQ